MHDLARSVAELAADLSLSGVVRIDLDGEDGIAHAFGWANRALHVPNTVDTQFGIASGTKGFTAMTVIGLIESGHLRLDTTARSLLGDDLPLIDDRVTVEQLLAHRSGIGDYFDEDVPYQPDDYMMPVPVHELAATEHYVRVLDGHPAKFAPGKRFSYSNGGYVVLAILAERAAAQPFHDLVGERVCRPAGLADTAFLRSDELPGRAALGYLDDGLRTNVFHLPVRGSGDGGIYTTAADMHRWWAAFLAGRIVTDEHVALMTHPTTGANATGRAPLGYGLGLWLDAETGAISVHGFDPGVGFVSARDPAGRYAFTVIVNTTRGAWPAHQRVADLIAEHLGPA